MSPNELTLEDLQNMFSADPPSKLYRIRRRVDGKFSTGTSSPRFTKNGKFFPHYSALQSHLLWFLAGPAYYAFDGDMMVDRSHKPDPTHYEVVEYTIVESSTKSLTEVQP